MNIQIHFECSPKVGLGHYRRTLTLAKEMVSREHSVELISLTGFLPEDAPIIYSNKVKPDVIVLDVTKDLSTEIMSWKKSGVHVLGLDYFGELPPDLVVSVFEHKAPLPDGKRKSGFEYILIREDIRQEKKNICDKGYVVVSLGGGDHLQQSVSVAEKLANRGCQVVLIKGPLACFEMAEHPQITVLESPSNFPQILAQSSWGVTNAGGCLFEMLCLGKPVHVIPQTTQEDSIAESFARKGSLLGVGMSSLKSYSKLEQKRKSDLVDHGVDGKGAVRIADEIERFLSEHG